MPTRPLRVRIGAVAVALGLAVALHAPRAVAQTPLLVEGTQTVYQRVLTRPGAEVYDAPGGRLLDRYAAFQPFYVFARQDGWVQVGPSASRPPSGWAEEGRVVDWKHNIVGAFTNPAGRSRQLIFDTEENLRWLMNHEALRDVQERLVAEASAGTVEGQQGVVSVEPAEFVNIRDELYVMPILDFVEDLHPMNYEDILLMQIASINKDEAQGIATAEPTEDPFDVGIVFVLDTTSSMRNYIALTQRILQDTVRRIAGTEIGDLVNFGVIGFRDNPEAVPELEYRTKVLVDLERRDDETPVIAALAEATNVTLASSPGFNEDSIAGVEDAIDLIDWDQERTGDDPINARYVILVTDAGPKDPRDPNARSEIGPLEIQAEAEDRGIAIMSLHLKTPSGAGTHDYAASAYRQLSRFAGREFYFPIEGGSEEAFEGVARRLVTAITEHVRTVQSGTQEVVETGGDEDLRGLFKSMELAWLGSAMGTQAPDVITGWVSDKAVEAPQALAIEPRLLVTKNEMATMAELLDSLVRLGEQSRSSEDALSFFGQVREVVADMARNPDMLVNADAQTPGGALEYLERLPYRSQILQLTEERWAQSAMMRRSIIDGMRQKLTQYRKWLFDASVWTVPYEGAPDGEHVFAMPFDVLP